MNGVFTVSVEKKEGFRVEADHLLEDLTLSLNLKGLTDIRVINRYDVWGIDEQILNRAISTIFSDPVVDVCHFTDLTPEDHTFSVTREYQPGQYDQRADSAEQCIQIISGNETASVKTSTIYLFYGELSEGEKKRIRRYLINPVDSRESRGFNRQPPENTEEVVQPPSDVEIYNGFRRYTPQMLEEFRLEKGLALSVEDLKFCRDYFSREGRDPTETEIRVIDTYWSDHCRHTTFSTRLNAVDFENSPLNCVKDTFVEYLADREKYGNGNKPLNLMEIATLRSTIEQKEGHLNDLVVSDEINACTIEIEVDHEGKKTPYNLLFKNETHNHPTEIEPFGGAATCLGGAIRDPLSGRAYVYQAMRISGSGDPRAGEKDSIPGKLPQRKITREAARGFSSYGNQIGLATGMVKEFYHEGYMAKRFECGAVIGAVPSSDVKRLNPKVGDLILLIGGRTGRDGCGGATGSSKSHDADSIKKSAAEVQKGNPPTERKLQRLFRNPEISKRIKKCNDFGAGGICVAIGELVEYKKKAEQNLGIEIDLDSIRKKYLGLTGTELAISESQERMAVVISPGDIKPFQESCREENLYCDVVAEVTDKERLIMKWRDKRIVDLSKAFLSTNGVSRQQPVYVTKSEELQNPFKKRLGKHSLKTLTDTLSEINQCSQKGLAGRFDATVGRRTFLMPFGGEFQLTPSQIMAARLPVEDGWTDTVSLMSHGFDPSISEWNPFHGAVYAVVLSFSKLVASGADPERIRLSFQEYFEKLKDDPERWGKPLSALLGAYKAQKELNCPAIGGKDSMSGTFNDLTVPPTLVSFGVGLTSADALISNELKDAGHSLILLPVEYDGDYIPRWEQLRKAYRIVNRMIREKRICSAGVTDISGVLTNLAKRAFGNRIGIEMTNCPDALPGSTIIEVEQEDVPTVIKLSKEAGLNAKLVGHTSEKKTFRYGGEEFSLKELLKAWQKPLENVFPTEEKLGIENVDAKLYDQKPKKRCQFTLKKGPRVFIPVFPGTNCEYDTQKAFEESGANCCIKVFRNLKKGDIESSADSFAREIDQSQILMIPGGFSAGDEPDGSGKFISVILRNPRIKRAVNHLLKKNDGLILGICNGFQALLRLGLLPYGEYQDPDREMPTLTYNKIGRHISGIVNTGIFSIKTPWIADDELGEVYKVPVSHTEGRFFCNSALLRKMEVNGQIATRYCDSQGKVAVEMPDNPNGSVGAVEGIISPDGRIFGKMGHNERIAKGLYKNIPGMKQQRLFRNGVSYFLV